MSEERYVVRDEDGDYWYFDNDLACCGPERVEHFKPDAYKLAAKVAEFYDGARVLKCKPGKPKPKAPREVFCTVDRDGDLLCMQGFDDEISTDAFYLSPDEKRGERVTRYVLAEGEK